MMFQTFSYFVKVVMVVNQIVVFVRFITEGLDIIVVIRNPYHNHLKVQLPRDSVLEQLKRVNDVKIKQPTPLEDVTYTK